ncbi:MAG TPA: isoprenylcysteine carboxylmethyltransferase family protein [Burkholderiaceae bacterium]|jgi:protein-S-isoprenylcysteine O-methyltransferase Ste14|nr:isoprenylcysteine carboxylmethyltransferase family protein [Burkholderiaceae bacterium]
MFETLIFLAVSAILLYISWGALRSPNSHGFYRFFAWESILGLVLLNFPVWTVNPFSPHQLLSWFLLISSIGLAIHAVRLLKKIGKPTQERADEALFGFEKTSSLVSSGAFKYIRHPMYASLIFLAWGAFLKQFSWLGVCLVLMATIFLLLTAKRDEVECLAHFGGEYRSYMQKTKRFIPFLF